MRIKLGIPNSHTNKENALRMAWSDQYSFKNSKIAYIPAERNLVAAIPNWFEVKLFDNNTLSYMKDWGEARQVHTKDNPFRINSIDAQYYYENGNDYVKVNGNGSLLLTNTSSGYQSIIPLSVLLYYFTEWVYNNTPPTSVESNNKTDNLRATLAQTLLWDKIKETGNDFDRSEGIQSFVKKLIDTEPTSELGIIRDSWMSVVMQFTSYKFSQLFIEEPEQNLFPATQMRLLYDLIQTSVKNSGRDDRLFITTHSPYILYALNNCMLGGLVEPNIPEEIIKDISCQNSFIDPKKVSVWEIKEGQFKPCEESPSGTIQDEDGLIRKNYFDNIMKEMMTDFNQMFNFYEPIDE